MKVLLALINNDYKVFGKGYSRDRPLLEFSYSFLANVLIMVGLGWVTSQGFINPGFITWGLLSSIPFGVSISLLNKEWQEGTTGWWLTLPYSRSLLLSAKCVASFLLVLVIYAFTLAFTILVRFIKNSTQPAFVPDIQLLDTFQHFAKDLTWMLMISPFSILLGALMVIIVRSHWVPKFSPFWGWVGIGFGGNLYVVNALGHSPLSASSVHLKQGYFSSVNGSIFFTTLLVTLAVSAFLFAFSVYVLDRHVEV